ncbi:muts domain V-domain-containing protein [Lipomyces oligophaga]|uniref:muts domain V-domain-containing protein n=1 Tax=Lipomyces oligophaga TaxID=45792 RepID=UPI0034CF2369
MTRAKTWCRVLSRCGSATVGRRAPSAKLSSCNLERLVTRRAEIWRYSVICSFNKRSYSTALSVEIREENEEEETDTNRLIVRKPKRKASKRSRNSPDRIPQGNLDPEPGSEDGAPPDPKSESTVESEVDKVYPTVLREVKNNMEKVPNCVLLTRVGSFYELYFEHAETYAPLLGLRLASRRTVHEQVPMAGFPCIHLDRYLKILVQDLRKYVALSEEFPNPEANIATRRFAMISRNMSSEADFEEYNDVVFDKQSVRGNVNMFIRKICRIITPGTLIDEKFLNPLESNYILSVSLTQKYQDDESDKFNVGLAWLDFSTGDFITQTSTQTKLSSDIARIAPSEIVLNSGINEDPIVQEIYQSIEEQQYFISFYKSMQSSKSTSDDLLNERAHFVGSWGDHFESSGTLKVSEINDLSYEELRAASDLLSYVQDKLPEFAVKVQIPVRRIPRENMMIDKHSLRALEIKDTLRDTGLEETLVSNIRRTVTKSGTRLLSQWLSSPTTSVQTITERQDLVEIFLDDLHLRQQIQDFLRMTHDSHRVSQRIALGRGEAEDMISLLQSIQNTEKLRLLLSAYAESRRDNVKVVGAISGLIQKLVDLSLLEKSIAKTFDQDVVIRRIIEQSRSNMEDLEQGDVKKKSLIRREAPVETMEIMKPSASRILQKLHEELVQVRIKRDQMEKSLRHECESPSVELRWAAGLGHHISVKARDYKKFESSKFGLICQVAISRKSSRVYHFPEFARLGNEIDSLRTLIRFEERKVFQHMRKKVIKYKPSIRENAQVLDELDVLCSFATLAHERKLVRPVMHEGTTHHVIGGRHPTVEYGLLKNGVSFTTNDCYLDENERMWVITGPNMGGKSTFLRQNALISILAQVGSYVPADVAELGIVDQIFSRVGSADSLYRNESTFMVEMLETASILNLATERSFVIVDELGRGTTPLEGLAIAYGALHHLYHVNQSRTLFATHFAELVDLTQDMEHVQGYCTSLYHDEHGMHFDHKLRKGVNRRSHALHVARLAGVPDKALEVAEAMLSRLERPVLDHSAV